MPGGAGDGVAAKEISAATDGARLPGKICVRVAMDASFAGQKACSVTHGLSPVAQMTERHATGAANKPG